MKINAVLKSEFVGLVDPIRPQFILKGKYSVKIAGKVVMILGKFKGRLEDPIFFLNS